MMRSQRREMWTYLHSYLGMARCGLVDEEWCTPQQAYAALLLEKMFQILDREADHA